MMKSIRFVYWLIAGLLLIGLLAACGSGGSSGSGSTNGSGNAQSGQKIYNEGVGAAPPCGACHSLSPNVTLVGPSLAGIATQAAALISSSDYTGSAETVEAYLLESTLKPDIYLTKGFPAGLMYRDYGKDLNEQQLNDLVAFMLTLK